MISWYWLDNGGSIAHSMVMLRISHVGVYNDLGLGLYANNDDLEYFNDNGEID